MGFGWAIRDSSSDDASTSMVTVPGSRMHWRLATSGVPTECTAAPMLEAEADATAATDAAPDRPATVALRFEPTAAAGLLPTAAPLLSNEAAAGLLGFLGGGAAFFA